MMDSWTALNVLQTSHGSTSPPQNVHDNRRVSSRVGRELDSNPRKVWFSREVDLRTQVLVPLFKAMGFNDVSHYRGGTGEQGKDITMLRANILGDREYYAVVATAGRRRYRGAILAKTAQAAP